MRLSTSDLPSFTVSFGIVAADECASLEEAVRLADDSLYLAKARGRDCAVIASTEPVEPEAGDRRSIVRVAERMRGGAGGVLATLARDDDPLDR